MCAMVTFNAAGGQCKPDMDRRESAVLGAEKAPLMKYPSVIAHWFFRGQGASRRATHHQEQLRGGSKGRPQRLARPLGLTLVSLAVLMGWAVALNGTSDGSAGWAADAVTGAPATPEQAAKVIDLGRLPRTPKAETPSSASIAELSYETGDPVPAAFQFHQQALLKSGWKELPGSNSTAEYASATFTKQGFRLSLMIFQVAEKSQITLINHSNVDLSKLPLPTFTKVFFDGPANRLLLSEKDPATTTKACREQLVKAGWTPYGTVPEIERFVKNGALLSVRVSTAPAQNNQTMIDVQATQLSYVIPLPEAVEEVNYDDSERMLQFQTRRPAESVTAFYRQHFEKQGWQATTESDVTEEVLRRVIFRNPAKEYAEVEIRTYDGLSEVQVQHQTAEQFAEFEARAKAAAEKAMAKNKPAGKPKAVSLALPDGASEIEQDENDVECKMPTGKARTAVTAWSEGLKKDGWKVEQSELSKEVGLLQLSRNEVRLDIDYVDPGFIPAQFSLSVRGGTLKLVESKK
jgi:hypothetical protein